MKGKVSRKNQFTYWLKHDAKDCGLMQPPCKDWLALQFLKDYLLGMDWYEESSELSSTKMNSQYSYV